MLFLMLFLRIVILPIIIIASSVAVYFDAKRIDRKTENTPDGIGGPISWTFASLFLWIFAFPLYLFHRRSYLRQLKESANGLPKSSSFQKWSVAAYVAVLLIIASIPFVDSSFANSSYAESSSVVPISINQSESRSISSTGVTGYKDYKFGTNYEAFKKQHPCKSEMIKMTTKGVDSYSCTNFQFNEKKVQANFYFIDNRLLRIALEVGNSTDDALIYVKALRSKYGEASSYNPDQIGLFDAHKIDSVDINWESDTVILRIFRYGGQDRVLVIYTSPTFEEAAIGKGADKLQKDL